MGDCACVYIGDYDSYSQVCDLRERTARKEHKCCECGRAIKKGEQYEYATLLYENEWDHYHTCNDCLSVRHSFFCEGFVFQGMWELLGEHINEMFGNISSDCLVDLTPGGREGVIEIIEECWERYNCDEDDEDDDDWKWRKAYRKEGNNGIMAS